MKFFSSIKKSEYSSSAESEFQDGNKPVKRNMTMAVKSQENSNMYNHFRSDPSNEVKQEDSESSLSHQSDNKELVDE